MMEILEIPELTRTKAQLESLGYPFIGVELKAGNKVFGHVEKFTRYTIYIKNKHGDVLDVPRRLIRRALLLIEGDKNNGRAEVLTKSKTPAE